MRTLDEVIKALEENGEIDLGCVNCVYADGCGDDSLYDDALNYLKEYKTNQEDPDGDHQQLEKAQKLLWEFYQNEPLTWDELKQMEGKPVWVEHRLFKGWRLIGWQANDHMMNLVGPYSEQLPLFADGCGSDWQAYRKERK